ncbi:hypothetical protein HAX54_001005, partial [Datura stramonium]|nr:hypothetical protein [Datura stramonium]
MAAEMSNPKSGVNFLSSSLSNPKNLLRISSTVFKEPSSTAGRNQNHQFSASWEVVGEAL